MDLTCKICGRNVNKDAVFQYQEPYYILCPKCAVNFYTCVSCTYGNECSFEKNSFGLPQFVISTERQGNTIMQQQILNPELMEETCKAGCVCWADDICLKRIIGNCSKYELAKVFKEF